MSKFLGKTVNLSTSFYSTDPFRRILPEEKDNEQLLIDLLEMVTMAESFDEEKISVGVSRTILNVCNFD